MNLGHTQYMLLILPRAASS